ncbi:MAG TPA: Hsp20/alpha crystallin family protein [Planctomycetota bacterium]|nr:Hsp20/alpha crystallin family protein [Planctomycetota bacterium]
MRPRFFTAHLALPTGLDEVFQVLQNGQAAATPREHTAALDIFEHADRFEVLVDLPGVNKEDVKLSLEGDRLEIRGERPAQAETEETSRRYRRTERWTGAFSRSLTLPSTVDGSRVQAKLVDGVLHLVLPKRDEEKPRNIPIGG